MVSLQPPPIDTPATMRPGNKGRLLVNTPLSSVPSCYSEKNTEERLRPPTRDDVSSGYGSPDSEIFDTTPH